MDLVQNKKAKFNYEIIKTFDAGIKLEGWEVKSLRKKQGSLEEAYLKYKTDEKSFFLISAHIPLYQPENLHEKQKDPKRKRKVLLRSQEIIKLKEELKKKGFTLIPLSFHLQGKRIKLRVALAKGKKKHDKREEIKKKIIKRETERYLKEKIRT